MEKPIYISRPSAPPLQDYIEEISDIWESRMFTNIGEKHKMLENKLESYLKVPSVSLFANGHVALEAAIQSLQLMGEVITTPFTFASTVLSIVRNGLKPVFCDINESDYTMDSTGIEELITPNTSAILPVHIYGNICDVYKIEKIANKHNIPVIYDAAHAFGITKDGVGIGNFGTISMFSFHATKVFHTVEGGGLTYQNKKQKEYFARYRNFGISEESTILTGANFKMSEIHAAMGLCNIRYIDDYIKKRSLCVEKYNELLSGHKGLILNRVQPGVKPNYSYYPLRIIPELFGQSRDDISLKLKEHNIYTRKYYFPLVSQFPIYKEKYAISDTPIAAMVADQILMLPLYSDLQINDVKRICNIILGD